MFIISSEIIIKKSNYSLNLAEKGGAIYLENVLNNSVIIDCNFFNNEAINSGGAIFLKNSNLNISNNSFI